MFQELPLPGAVVERRSWEDRLQADSRLFSEMLQTTFRESVRNMIVERWRVYCLTPHADRLLMWSHYSDDHRGLCLEFDPREPAIAGAYRVEYRCTLPVLDILERSALDILQIFVTKSPDWSYENEYRVLARDGQADKVAPQGPPITNNDFLPLSRCALTGIIAGCRSQVDKIKALVAKHAPGLPVKQAVQASDRYSLSIHD